MDKFELSVISKAAAISAIVTDVTLGPNSPEFDMNESGVVKSGMLLLNNSIPDNSPTSKWNSLDEAVKERVKKFLREEQSQREILDYKQELLRRQFEAKKTQDEKLFLQQIEEDAMRAKESQARLEQHHKQLAQKAVNVPVNAISHVSSAHMTDKYIKLSRLISGQPVEVGGSTVSASRHPQGVAFCKNLLAKKFVAQGELTVSSKPEAAFAIAAILVSLWVQFPDFGQLVLAHFHRECPYLVPLFMPQVENQSNQDFYKSLGYRYSEQGEVEKQPKFLKRMSGVMRLYTAIMVTRLRRQDQNKPHPHGLKQAWRWLVCMLNLEPKPDICATLILDFLEVSGYMMFATYGKEFQKLLHIILSLTGVSSRRPISAPMHLLPTSIDSDTFQWDFAEILRK
uniref:mRNA export factor GLE1 n=1 Tax=Timema californicum TaxID=61474 RepID=A0A7R9P4L8_TIMCA|nr:unnamed protein product [Timema californicum]